MSQKQKPNRKDFATDEGYADALAAYWASARPDLVSVFAADLDAEPDATPLQTLFDSDLRTK